MKIAFVSPLFESVPPKLYGGTERVVAYLVDELVSRGHDVTLFASGDSRTSARLRPMVERSLRLDPECRSPAMHAQRHAAMMKEVIASASEFDVIHFHIEHWRYLSLSEYEIPVLTTLHGRLDVPDILAAAPQFGDTPLISISDAQRAPLASCHWLGTIHHGLPPDLLALNPQRGSYLAFLGRIAPEKRPDRAIRIARRAGIPLRMAAKVDPADRAYFEECIRPLLRGPGVEFIDEIGDAEKQEFLGGAMALLFPIDWPEPFGLVMIEAMACGTPVIAWRCGSVPEIMVDGVTGYVVDDEDEAVARVAQSHELDRARCRAAFDERFTAARMARDYLAHYAKLDAPPMTRLCVA